LPRERLCQKPNPLARASTIKIGSKDFTGVVCLNGQGSATYEHSWCQRRSASSTGFAAASSQDFACRSKCFS
jgi:hypothetical protein